jgi:ABC-type transport system involved in multi-copper enzyme maturation permease subunit
MTILVIAQNTTREAIRNKILYSIVFFAFLMIGVSAVFGSASIGDEVKFIKDFGLLSISLFGVITTVTLGVTLLQKELGKKTILNILSKPVARWQFIAGKYLGLLATLTILVGIMTTALIGFLWVMEGRADWTLLLAAGSTLMELSILLAVALFWSSVVVTPALAGLFTAATFVAGRSSGYLQYFMTPDHSPLTQTAVSALYVLLPHLDRFWIADQIVYHQAFSAGYFLHLGLYAFAYGALALLAGAAFFRYREFT